MNTSFTNGPWKINGNSIMGQKPHQIFARTVAFVPDGPGSPSDEGVANARLIAAAPMLLDALIECHKSLLGHYTDGHVYTLDAKRLDDARAAINLATGQEP